MGCCDEWFWLFPNVPTCCGAPDAICCYEFTTKQCNLCAGDLGWTCGLDGHCHHDLARGTNGSSSCSSASFLRATSSHVDCSSSTCKEACECTNEHCDVEVQKCLGDAECAKVQDCAMKCGCGDDDCLLECAGKTSSPLALPVAECIKGKCSSASLLRTSNSQVDCGAATCKEACECTNEHCDAEVQKCLKNACEESCRCAKQKCIGPGLPCLLDPKCASFQACSFNCACGDADCAMACAQQTPSNKAMPLANCITQKCHTDLNI